MRAGVQARARTAPALPAGRLLPALRTALIAPDDARLWPLCGLRLIATDLRFTVGIGPRIIAMTCGYQRTSSPATALPMITR